MKAVHTANYKQILDMGSDRNLMSIDTGISGNIFSGHYFDMNAGHLQGKLLQQETDFEKIKKESYEMVMKPTNLTESQGDWVENLLRSYTQK
jgi:hypothetical protein